MNVTLVTHALTATAGQARVNLVLARHLLARGHTVHLIARDVDPALRRCPNVSVTQFTLPPRPHALYEPLFMLLSGLALRRARRGSIVVNNGTAALAHADVNYCHFCHSGYRRTREPYAPGMQSLLRHLYHIAITAVDALAEQYVYHRRSTTIVAVSGRVRDELVRDARVDPRRIRVILNGVDTTEFVPPDGAGDRLELRGELGLPEGPVLLFVGDLRSRRKGLDTILRALPRLPSPVHLLIAGKTIGSTYPAEVRAAGLDARVTFLGFRRDVPLLMRAVDVFVFPSHYEACSLVVLEAMASGLPVITTPAAGSSEVITPGVDGILLDDPADHDTLAQHVCELLMDPDRRKALGAAARVTAVRYDWSRVMVGVEELLLAHEHGQRHATVP